MIFADTWLMACQLREGIPVSDSEIFYQQASRLIDDTCVHLIEQDYSAAAVDLMQYAQCIFIDESVINRPCQDTDHLTRRYCPLRICYFSAQDKLRGLLRDCCLWLTDCCQAVIWNQKHFCYADHILSFLRFSGMVCHTFPTKIVNCNQPPENTIC